MSYNEVNEDDKEDDGFSYWLFIVVFTGIGYVVYRILGK